MRTVYLVRHGDTMDNAATPGPELERGWEPIGLADMGRKEVARTGRKLEGKGIKALISSDLPRAAQSARIVGAELDVEPEFHSQLRTWNLGELTGKPQAQADKVAAQLVRRAPDRVPPGGESFDQFRRRVFAGLSDVLANHPGTIAVVIHANVERLIEAWKAAGSRPDHTIDADVFLAQAEQPGHIEAWRVDPILLKLSHREVEFHEAKASGDRCGICKAYGGFNRCTKVKPPMDDDDWCAVGVRRGSGKWFEGPRL